ncbi:hypothetical protein [Actinomadura verrucosospora]|uniref:Uncharacterized protein n=1 Tax=Actinomadura verrucosospora TaxID=46165 RepID=A0A7D4AG43_ACTVE|nr:hypothetical protein [Actinomadura verrucosospora]QKG18368.1 hypothetical protein ACTIVE_0002 [Actinomadura verrucosospora]
MIGEPAGGFRRGDVLRISCPFTDAVVSGVHAYNVSIRWPFHVMSVDHFDPPLEIGRLPRSRRNLVLLRYGESEDPDAEYQGFCIDPDDDQPITAELLFRPYAFLCADDEPADSAGRGWRFIAPWHWSPFDGGTGTPVWPLALLHREGAEPADDSIGAVTAEISTGSHADELAHWERLTGASPPARSRVSSA